MSVVGTLTAIVCMLIHGNTDCTSGPWCVGILTTGSIALIGPALLSFGSALLLMSETYPFLILKFLSIGYSVLSRPVVLHEPTRENCAPHDSL